MRAVKICTAFGATLVLLWALIACGSDADRIREMNEDSVTSTSLGAEVSAMDIQGGDCISSALSEGISIETVEIVPCSGTWQYRVVSLFDVADSELYPGVEFFAEQASENCGRGNSFWMYPTTESWELGDRIVVCLQEAPAPRSSEDAPAAPDEETAEILEELTAEEVYSRISPSIPLIETPTAIGSGILIEGGYVVTNYHVVWPFDAAWVVFPGGLELQDVPVVGWDPLADVAVLGPIDVSVRPLKLEDGENMTPGSDLFLVGYPAETDLTPEVSITRGILSRFREWAPLGMTYFQSDAAIAGGQSGGALVDARGRVVGISTYRFSEAGFALATSAADDSLIVQRLIEDGDDTRPSDRRLWTEQGGRRFEVELANLWDTATFVFDPSVGSVHEFWVDGLEDGLFRVLDSLRVLLEVDDVYSGVESGTVETLTEGIHFMQVENLYNGPAAFSVESTVAMSPLLDPDDGRAIDVGETVAGTIDYFSDWDWYSMRLQEGETVKIATDSAAVDTFLIVDFPGSGGDRAVFDDDSGSEGFLGGATNSELVYRAPETGEYFIVVTDALDDGFGGYYLSVESAPTGTETVIVPSGEEILDTPFGDMRVFRDPNGYFQIHVPVPHVEEEPDPSLDEILFISLPDGPGYFLIKYVDLVQEGMRGFSLHEFAVAAGFQIMDELGESAIETSIVVETALDVPAHLFEYTDGEDIAIGLTFFVDTNLAAQVVYIFPLDLADPGRELAYYTFDTLQVY